MTTIRTLLPMNTVELSRKKSYSPTMQERMLADIYSTQCNFAYNNREHIFFSLMYSLDFRKRVFVRKQRDRLTFAQTSKRFGVGMRTVFDWQKCIEPKTTRNKPATKIDMKAFRG